MDQWEVAEILIGLFGLCVAAFLLYLLYVCYLKRCRGYRYENGTPKVAILRERRFGSAGMKHFSAASFRTSHLGSSLKEVKVNQEESEEPKRPHTFPLTSSSNLATIPEIRIDRV